MLAEMAERVCTKRGREKDAANLAVTAAVSAPSKISRRSKRREVFVVWTGMVASSPLPQHYFRNATSGAVRLREEALCQQPEHFYNLKKKENSVVNLRALFRYCDA